MSLNDSRTFCLMALVLGAAVSAYIVSLNFELPLPEVIVLASNSVPVIARKSGRVQTVYARLGSTVHVGDLLIQLDTEELLINKRALESQIHQMEFNPDPNRSDLTRVYFELDDLVLELGALTITSPADGKIIAVKCMKEGDMVEAGNAIAVIGLKTNGETN